MNSFDIIKTVRITEKGTKQGELNQYTVVADRRANKIQIRKAVQELFPNVHVIRVNTMNVRGKLRRQRTTSEGRTSNWKKAIVTLKEGDKIILT